MAGGAKETPRQKMIGMMYLVLTALLALQISNAVLDKFVFIDDSLEHSVHVTRDGNQKLLEGIKASVEKNGNREDDRAVLARAEKTKEMTSTLVHTIDSIRRILIDYTGGKDPETGAYNGAKDYDKVMFQMIGPEGGTNGMGYTVLQKQMDMYVEKLRALTKNDSITIEDLTPDAKELDVFKNNPDQKGKDFVKLNFDHTPLVASLAILNHMKSEIAQTETKVVGKLAEKVGGKMIKFDKILAMANAESNIVAAGTPYKAEMFIAASSTSVVPRMNSTAGPIKVENGVGKLEFIARAASYDADGKSKQTWKGTITIKGPNGDTTFNFEKEYVVAKPVVQVQGAAISALYLNCGNELNIQVPSLGQTYDPSFRAEGGTVIPGGKKGFVIIVPNSPKVRLFVSSGGMQISDAKGEEFSVKPIPKPTIELLGDGGKKLDLKQGGTMPRGLTAKAIPDPTFKEQNPKDARYAVTNWEVVLARGKRPVKNNNFNSAQANLNQLAADARPGDRLVITVKGVTRTNFQNATEQVKMAEEIISYPIQ